MPLISVIIPVYNGEKTIRETIESVLKQTFTDFELIVINDGSQDKTWEIVSSIQDSRLRVFSYPNANQAASRNRGLYHAVAEYISFIDADDLWTPDKLETQLKALQNNPQAAVAYSWTDYIDESGKFLHRGSYLAVTGNVYANLLLVNFLENGSNPLIRKKAFTEVGNFDESLPPAEDWDMWLRLAARYNFVAIAHPQVLYRVCASSMSANIFRLESTCLQVVERAFNRAPESLQYLKPYSLANIYKYITYKALLAPVARRKGLAAARCFWQAVRHDPALLPERRNILKLLIKIAVMALLPSKQAQVLIDKSNTLSQIHNLLLNYIRTELL